MVITRFTEFGLKDLKRICKINCVVTLTTTLTVAVLPCMP